MSQVLPRTRIERIRFFEARLAQWTDNAAAIGLTADQMTAFTTLITRARGDYDNMQIARNTARSATVTHYDSEGAMTDMGSALIKTIKAFATVTDDPAVYAAASIPVPAMPSPQGAPATPLGLSGHVLNTGAVELRWEAPAGGYGSGVHFTIERRITDRHSANGPWMNAGAVGQGSRQWIDEQAPIGAQAIAYRITAWRGELASDATDPVQVLFGTTVDATSNEEAAGGGGLSLAA